MKIRIKGNSVRMRLSRTEVEEFGQEGYFEEKTCFGSSEFVYALQKILKGDMLSADFKDRKLTVYIPENLAQQWTSTDIVSFNGQMPLDQGRYLALLIEKDFKCMDGDISEDQSDNYENPNKSC